MPEQKVLIIDDDADMRRLLALWMTKQDYQTVFAADVIQAIALARQHRPDLILLDLRIPAGNGFIVIERLRALTLTAGIPIIIISADKTPESEMQAVASGVTAYLQKPFAQEALLAAVRSALPGSAVRN